MELIQQNIKLYCRFNDGRKEFALSENNKVGYIINASPVRRFTCIPKRLITGEVKVEIDIDNKNIFLTRDNIIFFRNHNAVIDLNNKTISYVDHNEKIELKRNLSNRKSIIISNT
jgi:hypothetical protein